MNFAPLHSGREHAHSAPPLSKQEPAVSVESQNPAPVCIEIPGDVLIPDEEFCQVVLGGCTRRTATRYEREGLPFVMVAGKKYRPLGQGRAWLASRIKVRRRRS
jgi:hypothetical protein